MSQKNLNVQNKTHKFLIDKLKDERTLQIYKKFENNFNLKKNLVVNIKSLLLNVGVILDPLTLYKLITQYRYYHVNMRRIK